MASCPGKKLLILDCDAGVDDAQALMMALAHPDVEVLGITCVDGNTALNNVCTNVFRLLSVCDRLKIPVYRGAETSLVLAPIRVKTVHGSDGFGDKPDCHPFPEAEKFLQKEPAVTGLISLTEAHPGQITIVAVGPLTNLALAHRVCPEFSHRLKELYIMGGNYKAFGNRAPCVEFNFFTDPESARIVLTEFSCVTHIAPLETCLDTALDYAWYESWVSRESTKAQYLRVITEDVFRFGKSELGRKRGTKGWVACDTRAMAAFLDPESVTETVHHHCTVELQGSLTRGQMVVDWADHLKQSRKINIITNMDKGRIERLLEAAVQ